MKGLHDLTRVLTEGMKKQSGEKDTDGILRTEKSERMAR